MLASLQLAAVDGSGEVTYVLEQFHGPTCAFKDVALQFVGNLFEFFLARQNEHRKVDTAGLVVCVCVYVSE